VDELDQAVEVFRRDLKYGNQHAIPIHEVSGNSLLPHSADRSSRHIG
jgi:hypothetical protein